MRRNEAKLHVGMGLDVPESMKRSSTFRGFSSHRCIVFRAEGVEQGRPQSVLWTLIG